MRIVECKKYNTMKLSEFLVTEKLIFRYYKRQETDMWQHVTSLDQCGQNTLI